MVLLVILMVLCIVQMTMLAILKKDFDNLQVKVDEFRKLAQVKFGVVQDPKRGMLGIFADSKEPTKYIAVEMEPASPAK